MKELTFTSMEVIEKGWSADRKYCVMGRDGVKRLLRISPVEQYERKRSEFEMMKWVAALGVPMCRPLEFGVCQEGVYSLQSWIEGRDAEEELPLLRKREQYAYGLEAGRILKTIHSIPAPETQKDWEIYFNRKVNYKIKSYLECPVHFDGADKMIEYIDQNRGLLRGWPQSYQHGDYHIGNLMIGDDRKLYVIDFNRNDFGDPWEEFNRIVWCAQASAIFASGMVEGYFDGAPPFLFWRLLALYIASNTLSSMPWAIPFGQGQIDVFLRQAKEVLAWYDGMRNPIPAWYHVGQVTTLS